MKFSPDKVDLHVLLAADQADARDYKAAGAEVDAVLTTWLHDLQAYDINARLAPAQNDSAGAENVYALIKMKFLGDPTRALRFGQLCASQKKFDAPLRGYGAAIRIAPSAPGAVKSYGPAGWSAPLRLGGPVRRPARPTRPEEPDRAVVARRTRAGSRRSHASWQTYLLTVSMTDKASLERASQFSADAPRLQLHLRLALYKKGDAL